MSASPNTSGPRDLSPLLRLLVASATGLFFELALIRYLDSTVQVIAYFNSFLILSAFLGLGAGSLMRRTERLLWMWPFAALALFGAAAILDRMAMSHQFRDQVFWTTGGPGEGVPVFIVVPLVFLLNTAFFIPLGSLVGSLFDASQDTLRAYSFDIFGSLAGVVGFTILSFLGTPPWVWMVIGAVAAALAVGWSSRGRALAVAAGLLAAGALTLIPSPGRWSPYYKVQLADLRDATGRLYGQSVFVNGLRIQDALVLDGRLDGTRHEPWRDYYELPYALAQPESVLILGGGSGNDATVALRSGATRVDVVEIDPVIISLGHDVHPHRPYLDERVRAITDDARAWLRRSDEKYDLIVMNALDSHHQLPGLSTLRLESYIYTVEAFRDARRHMHDHSLLVVHLSSTRQWMGDRLYWSLTEAFGTTPRLYWTPDSPFQSLAFVVGDVASIASPPRDPVEVAPAVIERHMAEVRDRTPLATDDWPHLYLAAKQVPAMYLGILLAVLLVSGGLVFAVGAPSGRDSALHFALLGAGFMLLQTRSITKVALLFGSTWLVIALVIGFILACIWLANALVRRGRAPRVGTCMGLLVVSLILGYAIPLDFLLEVPMIARVMLAGAWVALPILFASMLFSHSFARCVSRSGAFGANLLGVAVGGLLEYGSMVFGLQALYLLALGIYLLAFVSGLALMRREPTPA